jgi:hypothetical protein
MEKKELESTNEMGERLLRLVEKDPDNENICKLFDSYIKMVDKMSENLYQIQMKSIENYQSNLTKFI